MVYFVAVVADSGHRRGTVTDGRGQCPSGPEASSQST